MSEQIDIHKSFQLYSDLDKPTDKMIREFRYFFPLLIGPSRNAAMGHLGEGTQSCPFTITANGHGRLPSHMCIT